MSHEIDSGEVLATVEASPARRVIGVAMLIGLGLMTLYVAMASTPGVAWQGFLMLVSGLALWMGYRMWHATAHRIELTAAGLRCSDGTEIIRIQDLQHLDRGFFAFKPSNGFLMRSTTSAERCWYPGLWWRMGRRIGVGGVTPGSQTKTMTEILAALMVERDAG
ncbi:hypothetical protein TM1040_2157 [Ruegeria sp. TM1040]|jgi:hypothetical protein|uniref:hypothetical protein n=1 Tax=Ruegeria sp. (strain TM1040) TaxID=292414 RepID=UPI0000462FC1|nr:hypothetical protein [Ruegeria sp. TM1040]ABF64889.1 hypothetical protein TM1040_2157 [Ruegeria sp. TM1040]MDF9303455.1 hypothetical protein [Tritonibacter mobilis]